MTGCVALGYMSLATISIALGHSDSRMFGQPTPAPSVQLSATPIIPEVRLPPHTSSPSNLFSLTRAHAGPQAASIKTYGLVVPNSQAMVDVNMAVSGQVVDVYVRVGDSVRKGQPIASVFNPEFITTQKGYLEFLKNEDKLQVLREEGRLPNYLKDAKENLRWWGMNDKQIATLIEHGKVVEHIMLNAPTDGYMTELLVQPGSLVNAGDRTMKQFVVVGKAIARMVSAHAGLWAEAYVYPDQRTLLRPGLSVHIALPNGRTLKRAITQILSTVEPTTQRARFLVDLGPNTIGLVVGQTVDINIQLSAQTGTWIPRQAVLGQMINPVVYVQTHPGRYLRKPVVVLGETANLLQVAGIQADEKMVVSGKMMLEGLYRISAGASPSTGNHHHDDHTH